LNLFYHLIQGDCLEALSKIDDNSINLVVTSPPYNVGVDYGVYKDNLDWDEYYKWCERWMREIYRVLKPDGRACLDHYISFGSSKARSSPALDLHCLSKKIGFKHHALVIWEERTRSKYTAWGSWLSASAPCINSPYEAILILYKDQWKRINKGKSTIAKEEFLEGVSGIWRLGTDKIRLTPATFPESLPRRCINLFTFEGDVVLDPFMGSGTTMKAAQDLKRSCIGIEINPDYCETIKKRCFGRMFLDCDVEYRFEIIE